MSGLCSLLWYTLIGLFRSRAALEAEILVVLVGNSGSNILVVEPTQDRHGQGLTDGLDRTWDRRVLLQGQMGSGLVVVFLICVEQMTKVPLAKHNDMVKAIPPDLIAMLLLVGTRLKAEQVNCEPWSVLKMSGLP
jgi:hypothetical protein